MAAEVGGWQNWSLKTSEKINVVLRNLEPGICQSFSPEYCSNIFLSENIFGQWCGDVVVPIIDTFILLLTGELSDLILISIREPSKNISYAPQYHQIGQHISPRNYTITLYYYVLSVGYFECAGLSYALNYLEEAVKGLMLF